MDIDNKNSETGELSTSDIISGILTRYNIKENSEELARKYFDEGGDSNGGIIFWVASKLAIGEKTEKDLVAILAEKLHTSQKISEQMTEEIKKILLPTLKKNSTKKIPASPASFKPKPIVETIATPIQKLEQKNIIAKKKEKGLPPTRQIKETSEINRQSNNGVGRKNDTYREPIE